ncbi:MAG: GIY-YIG nuclease family protein [Rubellimicrobium sp.]|nr:GIY-YIG nuclease family protein [Rubellimicrobium sp.]
MRVTSYGLFWRADEIEWTPGRGVRNEFRLLGRFGVNRPKLRVADFRQQQGIYILFNEYGPAYVGLARGDRLGARLQEHRIDHLAEKWDRFSWFGFNPVNDRPDTDGVLSLRPPVEDVTDNTPTTIGDLEALLISVIGPRLNQQKMNFDEAKEWHQIGYWEWRETYQQRVAP